MRRLLLLSLYFLLTAVFCGVIRAQDYRVVELQPPNGSGTSTAFDINGSGQVVGWGTVPGGQVHAVHWQNGFALDLGTMGGARSEAHGINAIGWVTGESRLTVGASLTHAFLWNPNTLFLEDLGSLNPAHSHGRAVNLANRVVGDSGGIAPGGQAFFTRAFQRAGAGLQDLGTLGGCCAAASDISDSGTIVGGASNVNNQNRAFLLQPGGSMLSLGTLGGQFSFAEGLNTFEEVVGHSFVTGNPQNDFRHAFRWNSGGGMADLGTLGGTESTANDVSDQGVIVGWAEIPGDTRRAFRWLEGQGMVDLNDHAPPGTGWVLKNARAVNNDGWIVGNGDLNGVQRGFLLIPLIMEAPHPRTAGAFNFFTVTGAEPGRKVWLTYGFQPGNFAVPGCPGRTIDIRSPRLAGIETADATGAALFVVFVPAGAAGRNILLQAVQKTSCAVTPLRSAVFQ